MTSWSTFIFAHAVTRAVFGLLQSINKKKMEIKF